MRIIMLVTNPFKPDPRVYKEAKSLVKHGNEVYIVAWDREGKYPKFEEVNGIKVIRTGPRAGYGRGMVLKLPLFYLQAFKESLKLRPDVLHTHDFDTAVLGFLFKFLKGIKWVYDVHDLYDSFITNKTLSRLVRLLDSVLIHSADVVITVNPEMTRILVERSRPKATLVIMNTIEPFRFNENKSKKFTVFYGGVLSPGRFIEEMIQVANSLGIDLRMAGVGVLEDSIKSSSAVFLGFLPHEQAVCELSKAYVTFILYDPSVINNRIASPNKLFEAMWVGTPVIVVKGTLPEKLAGKFVVPVEYSEGAVEEVLKVLIENPKILKKRASTGRKIFLKKYTWGVMERKLKLLYSEVL